jgi:hypothetical protein
MPLVAIILIVTVWAACGGGGSNSGTGSPPKIPGTPTGMYTLTVTATYTLGTATVQHFTLLNLTVN